MGFEFKVAWRFMLKATDKGGFSAMTLYAWLAIAVGMAATGTLLSVMYGFESTLRDRVLTAYPHILVRPKESRSFIKDYQPWLEKLAAHSGVVRSVPFLDGEMILQSPLRTLGAVVWGVPEPELQKMSDKIVKGKAPGSDPNEAQMIVGSELADRVGVSVGSSVKLISPLLKTGPMGSVPLSETFEVSGIFTSGHYEFDQQYLYVLLSDAQALLKKPGVIAGWHIWCEDIDDAEKVANSLRQTVPSHWEVETWRVFNSALFESLKLEQFAMFTILSFAILVAVMNITITLLMNIYYKKKNIGVLRSMGASQKQIKRIFLWEGLMLGGVGLLGGAILTGVLIFVVQNYEPFQLPAIYYDRSIPVEVRWQSLSVIYAVGAALILLATWLPSKKAAELDPVKAIREG